MENNYYLLTAWVDTVSIREEIIRLIKQHYAIVDCCEIKWSESSINNNIKRFYGNISNSYLGVRDICKERYLFAVVFSEIPTLVDSDESRIGSEQSYGITGLINEIRRKTDSNSFVYVTTNSWETNRGLTLLFGLNTHDFLSTHVGIWNGTVSLLKQDIAGENQWESLSTFFYVINNTVLYVVLRGEEFFNGINLEDHGDIDLLVDDIEDAKNIINGYKVIYSSPVRPKIFIKTESEGSLLLDLWSSKIPYHSPEWHKNMFNTRKYTGLYYKLNEENEFYSLIYHCLVHKKYVASDYLLRLNDGYKSLGLYKQYDESAYTYIIDLYYQVLVDYMQQNQYGISQPIEDGHCFYNKRIKQYIDVTKYLREITGIECIRPYRVNEIDISEYLYFLGIIENNNVIIKYGGIEDICANEYYFSKRVSDYNSTNFLKPISAKLTGGIPFIVFKHIGGESIDNYIKEQPDNELFIRQQLTRIVQSLNECGVIHRNITPENLVVSNHQVLLLNFQYAASTNKDRRNFILNGGIEKTMMLGGNYRYKKYAWKDIYSVNSILKNIGAKQFSKRDAVSTPVVKMPMKEIVRLSVKEYYIKTKVCLHYLLFSIIHKF